MPLPLQASYTGTAVYLQLDVLLNACLGESPIRIIVKYYGQKNKFSEMFLCLTRLST